MKQLNINGKSLLLVPVPDGITNLFVKMNLWGGLPDGRVFYKKLPSRDWELIGNDPLNLTEEEAREIVEYDDAGGTWLNYETNRPVMLTALESLSSLLRANQMEKAIFLINKSKQNEK